MDAYPYEVLKDMFQSGAIGLREPQFRKLPFRVDYGVLETNPIIREHIFRLLAARIDARAYDAVTSALDSCKALSAIFADRCGLPFIIPLEIVPVQKAPIVFYGHAPRDGCLLMLNAYNMPHSASEMDSHPFVYVLNVLRAERYRVAKIVSIFDADRQHVFRRHLSALGGKPVAYDVIFEMQDVLRMVKSCPADFGLKMDEVLEAIKHYERNQTIVPPTSAV